MHLSDVFKMHQHSKVHDFRICKQEEGVCRSAGASGGQRCFAVSSDVGHCAGDCLGNTAASHTQGSLSHNGRL